MNSNLKNYQDGSTKKVNQKRTPLTNSICEWTVTTKGEKILPNGLRVSDEQIFVLRTDGLSVIDTRSGKQEWKYIKSIPTYGIEITDNRVYLGVDEGVICLDRIDGTVEDTYTVQFPDTDLSSNKFVIEDSILYIVNKSSIEALNIPEMDQLWRLEMQSEVSGLCVGNEYVYSISPRKLTAVNKRTGKIRAEEGPGPDRSWIGLFGISSYGPVTQLNNQDAIYDNFLEIVIHSKELDKDIGYFSGLWDSAICTDNNILLRGEEKIEFCSLRNKASDPHWAIEDSFSNEFDSNASKNIDITLVLTKNMLYVGGPSGIEVREVKTGSIISKYNQMKPIQSMVYANKFYIASDAKIRALRPACPNCDSELSGSPVVNYCPSCGTDIANTA
jgi:hypothetical protein